MTNTIDPLGGAYFVEALTDELERQAYDYFAQDRRARRHGRGGQAELPAARDRRRQPSSCRRRSTRGERIVVGVNAYTEGDDADDTPILRIDPALERKQIDRVQAVRARRDAARRRGALDARCKEPAARATPT